ncbi:MAG: ATP-binding protein [Hyphomonadaceae bacterium]|nr:ATP-binding protein [Hyphomonadaceae bacterium]
MTGQTKPIPPGEGERRAQRGYVPQYDLAAHLIYFAMAAGRLRWIGVADRGAGSFDDIVLGLADRTKAYQVKSSGTPEPFTVSTALTGAAKILARMIDARAKLAPIGGVIETIFVTDDYPRLDDNVGTADKPVSSAAFVRALEAHRESWTLDDWLASAFAPLITTLKSASQLDDAAFAALLRGMQFNVGVQPPGANSPQDQRRIGQIAALLPRLAADRADQDRWALDELLTRLNWRDAFALRHEHAFPVDALYQSNQSTQRALLEALGRIESGYCALVGAPGSGKSTLLAAGLLPAPRALIARYLAFLPNEGHGLGRAEAENFLQEVVKQLKQQDLGQQIIPGVELSELQQQFATLLQQAAQRYAADGVKTLIVVDGLDHVPREERPARSFLSELPLPHAVPKGVVFVLGTQKLDLDGMAPAVRDQAGTDDRRVEMSALPPEAVAKLANAARVPADVDRVKLFERTLGHPLSVRYAVERLTALSTEAERRDWLSNGPAFGGDVETYYSSVWHELEDKADARTALAYLALIDGAIASSGMDALVGAAATDAADAAARHLIARDRAGAWSIFHNSFRLFLRERTGLRHGVEDRAAVQQRYRELAHFAARDDSGPQRWLELRYRARAGDHDAVAALATLAMFRQQFVAGRDPSAISADIDFAFRAAHARRDATLLLRMVLTRQELTRRVWAFDDDVIDALIASGQIDTAKGVITHDLGVLSKDKRFDLVDALMDAGRTAEAKDVFHRAEPLDALLGSKPIERHSNDDALTAWAERALIFYEPEQFNRAIDRLYKRSDPHYDWDLDAYKRHLRHLAARGQLNRDPSITIDDLAQSISLNRPRDRALLLYFAASAAFQHDLEALAKQRIADLTQTPQLLPGELRSELAWIAAQLNQMQAAAVFIADVTPQTLAAADDSSRAADFPIFARRVLVHAAVRGVLDQPLPAAAASKTQIFRDFQTHLERVGRVLGAARAGRSDSAGATVALRDMLSFLELATAASTHMYDRSRIDLSMPDLIVTLVRIADLVGPQCLSSFATTFDQKLAAGAKHLSDPAVRRAYARAMFAKDADGAKAIERISFDHCTQERTPSEQLVHAAETAAAYLELGDDARAAAAIEAMHLDGFGYALAAKKDPQYIWWRECYERACAEDPARRVERTQFFVRLLYGMSKTVGDNAGGRIIDAAFVEAGREGGILVPTVCNLAERSDLSAWPDLVRSVVKGIVAARPGFARAAAIVYGHLALPFTGRDTDFIGRVLVEAATDNDLAAVVETLLVCTLTGAHPFWRATALAEVEGAARKRGLAIPPARLQHWMSITTDDAGGDDLDPFSGVNTLAEFESALKDRKGASDWRIRRAFERLITTGDYPTAKRIFENTAALSEYGPIEVLAERAVDQGARADADEMLKRLKVKSDERGSWGGWSGDARLKYHRVAVKLGGEPARRAAFDQFASDLAEGRESIESMLPALDEVLRLISPTVSWQMAWDCLAEQLEVLREFRLGGDFKPPIASAFTCPIAELLERACLTTCSDLGDLVHVAARDLETAPYGGAIVAELIQRLWRTPAQRLRAAQLAWERRTSAEVEAAARRLLPEMVEADDIAIRDIAARLAEALSVPLLEKSAPLPTAYQLHYPVNPADRKFEPPSGASLSSAGLWTDDPLAWTWPLELPMLMTNDAAGVELAALRRRTASLMGRAGGKDAFGPDAQTAQRIRLGCLKLGLLHRKLGVEVAFRAMREAIGELRAADELDAESATAISFECGAPTPLISPIAASPRPEGIATPNMPSPHHTNEQAAWREGVAADIPAPQLPGYIILAATASFQRKAFADEWTVEQYWGPDTGEADEGLEEQVVKLPRVMTAHTLITLYDSEAPWGVARPQYVYAGQSHPLRLMLCPRVTARLGWRPAAENVFTTLDEHGAPVAQSLLWRDGGLRAENPDTGMYGVGCVLAVRADRIDALSALRQTPKIARAWRAFGHAARRHSRETNVATLQVLAT